MSEFKDTLYNASGFLEIWKDYEDGTEPELVYANQNTITSGMGVTLAHLFSASGSNNILDYQIRWFQVGSGTQAVTPSAYELDANLNTSALYGTSADIITSEHDQWKNGSIVTDEIFARIEDHHIHKVGADAVRFLLVLPKNAANDLSYNLQEIGLFAHNPSSQVEVTSILVAYRTFTALTKSSDFALIFKWMIQF